MARSPSSPAMTRRSSGRSGESGSFCGTMSGSWRKTYADRPLSTLSAISNPEARTTAQDAIWWGAMEGFRTSMSPLCETHSARGMSKPGPSIRRACPGEQASQTPKCTGASRSCRLGKTQDLPDRLRRRDREALLGHDARAPRYPDPRRARPSGEAPAAGTGDPYGPRSRAEQLTPRSGRSSTPTERTSLFSVRRLDKTVSGRPPPPPPSRPGCSSTSPTNARLS